MFNDTLATLLQGYASRPQRTLQGTSKPRCMCCNKYIADCRDAPAKRVVTAVVVAEEVPTIRRVRIVKAAMA